MNHTAWSLRDGRILHKGQEFTVRGANGGRFKFSHAVQNDNDPADVILISVPDKSGRVRYFRPEAVAVVHRKPKDRGL